MTLGGRDSAQRKVSRQDRRQELDREQWADLDRVHFRFTAEGLGEAFAGDYLFGRAFDAPPFFTFSSVSDLPHPITVGIAEWIRDDQGMYVGARLWLKNNGINCIEPLVYGDNILRDPGFELHGSAIPKGPDGEHFPGEFGYATTQPTPLFWVEGFTTDFRPYREWWSNDPPQIAWDNIYRGTSQEAVVGTQVHPPRTIQRYGNAPVPGWAVFSNNGLIPPLFGYSEDLPSELRFTPRWFITDASPDRGSQYHARISQPNNELFAAYIETELYPIGFEMCRPASDWQGSGLFDDTGQKGFWACRVLPGDKATLTVRAKSNYAKDPINTDVGNNIEMYAYYWREENFLTGDDLFEQSAWMPLDTHYQSFTFETTAPAEAQYLGLEIFIGFDRPGSNFPTQLYHWDVDNCSLKLEPAPGNENKAEGVLPPLVSATGSSRPEYEITVRFEGRTLKSYAAIHHVEKQAAPDHVILS